MALREEVERDGPLVELASGIDALYLSGRCELLPALFELLGDAKAEAQGSGVPVPLVLGGVEWRVLGHGMNRYRWALEHEAGFLAVSDSERLPPLRAEPRAEFLHGVGPRAAVEWFEGQGELLAGGPVLWSVNRLDLFCDVQGWSLCGDDRDRFVCRASKRDLHEDNETFNGLGFGRRTTKTISARIYDKTIESAAKGSAWWRTVWGSRYDEKLPVLRVEFEIGRKGLTEFGVNTPDEAFERIGGIWAAVTENWLTFRVPTGDQTRSRWPVDPRWAAIQQAGLRNGGIGIERVRAGHRIGELGLLIPGLVGYAASVGAILDLPDIGSTLAAIRHLIETDERRREVAFVDRIAQRRERAAIK